MPSLEDFTQELFDGTKKEIDVPKEKVTELSPGWKVSKINLPHKGSKGSMRNGRLHAHDMGDHYSVHLDTVDPEESGFGHLVKDAPLVLMIWSGFSGAMGITHGDEVEREEAKKAVRPMAIIGVVFLIMGLLVMIEQRIALGLVVLVSILGLLGIGGVFIYQGIMNRAHKGTWVNFIIGLAAIIMGIVIFIYPGMALLLIVLALVVWTLASAMFLIFGRGDKLLFDEFSLVPLAVGIVSLIVALLLIFDPRGTLNLVVFIGGLLLFLIGAAQAISAVLVYRALKKGKTADAS